MTFEEWYIDTFGCDTCYSFSFDDLKDAWEAAYKEGFKDGKDKGDHEV